jgi:hypothetical protein
MIYAKAPELGGPHHWALENICNISKKRHVAF